jgi:hypothetical protein
VSAKTNVLIVTDGKDKINSIANSIKELLSGCKVTVCSGENFAGTEILPADAFFLGCEASSPSSFAYIQDMLAHINFASRKCGVFSTNEEAAKYLGGIVKDCEADTGKPLIASGDIQASVLKDWLKETMGKISWLH